jgi:ribosomal protein S16
MVLKLRLARPATPGGSRKHHPRYNIVLAHARYATNKTIISSQPLKQIANATL